MKKPNIKPLPRLSQFRNTCSQQEGFTLIEIMIAITIGLLMMAGILQISAASKESSRLQRNLSFVQENIRISTEMLGRDIRQAGYFEDDNPADPISALDPFVDLSGPTTNTDTAITADGGGANSDQITITYESDTDCLGRNTFAVGEEADNHFAENHYFIENQRLMCRGNGIVPVGENAQEALVEGVESMQILYGENTDGDPRSANRYVQAGVADPENIVSVRIALRFHSREHVRQSVDNNQYALLDATAVGPAANDKRLRREITTTIALRNASRN